MAIFIANTFKVTEFVFFYRSLFFKISIFSPNLIALLFCSRGNHYAM